MKLCLLKDDNISSPQVILALAVTLSEATQYRRHELPGGVAGFLPRMRIGRNSKLRPDTGAEAEAGESRDVTKLLADLKKQLAEVTADSFDTAESVRAVRLAKENKSKFNIEQHSFSLESGDTAPGTSVIQQPQQQFYNQQQYNNNNNKGFNQQQRFNNNNNQGQQFYNQQQQYNNPSQYQQQQFSQPQQQSQPRQIVQGKKLQ